jgi:hypothetical protein
MKRVLVKEPTPYWLSANRYEEKALHILNAVQEIAQNARATDTLDVGALRAVVAEADTALRHAKARGASETELLRYEEALAEAQRTLVQADPRSAERRREQGIGTNVTTTPKPCTCGKRAAHNAKNLWRSLAKKADGSVYVTREQAATLRNAGWTLSHARY